MTPNTADATHAALAVFQATTGTEAERVVAALAEYQAHLLDAGVVVLPQPAALGAHATVDPVQDAEDAAQWLAIESGHPRFGGSEWRALLTLPHLLDLAALNARQRSADQNTQATVTAAVRVLKAHHAATGVSTGQAS